MDESFPPPAFDGFPADAFAFFEGLAAHQDREWFAANKTRYERAVLAPLGSLVADLSARLAADGLPLHGDARRTVFRINRDVRFSKNKDPYKTNAGAVLTRDGVKHAMGVLYMHIAPTGSFAAVGFHQPAPAMLHALRTAIAQNARGWREVEDKLASHGLALTADDALVRLPRGFEGADESVAAALRLKSWIVTRPFSRADLGGSGLIDKLIEFALQAEPLLRFGWSALDRLPPEAKRGAFAR